MSLTQLYNNVSGELSQSQGFTLQPFEDATLCCAALLLSHWSEVNHHNHYNTRLAILIPHDNVWRQRIAGGYGES